MIRREEGGGFVNILNFELFNLKRIVQHLKLIYKEGWEEVVKVQRKQIGKGDRFYL